MKLERRLIANSVAATPQYLDGFIGADTQFAEQIAEKLVELVDSTDGIDWATLKLESKYDPLFDCYVLELSAIDNAIVYDYVEQLERIAFSAVSEAHRKLDDLAERLEITPARFVPRTWADRVLDLLESPSSVRSKVTMPPPIRSAGDTITFPRVSGY